MRFVLLDETLTDRGFWVLLDGVDLELFIKNPVMYWMHIRPSSWENKDEQWLPIGRWEDIKVELINGIKSITAEAVFDEKDEFAMKIKDKVDGNFIRMASAGLWPLTISDEAKYLKSGQTRSTLVACEMKEASIVDIGANRNAVRLYDEARNLINLSSGSGNEVIPLLNLKLEINMKSIALKLGIGENATENEILHAIGELLSLRDSQNVKIEQLEGEKVAILLKSPAVTDENKAAIEKLAKTDFELATQTVKALEAGKEKPKPERISDFMKKTANLGTAGTGEKKWEDYSDEEKVLMRDEDTESYVKLYASYYGHEPKL